MKPNVRAFRRSAAARGLSIVECSISVVIVGVALVAALSTVGAARRGEQQLTDSRQAMILAEDLLSEIAAQPYSGAGDTATVFGPNTGESTPGNRSLFNDVNDYRNRSENPPLAKDGSSLGLSSTWKRVVQVDFVNPANPNVASTTDQGLAHITVQVVRTSVTLASLSTLRSAGLPATEMCTLPNGTIVNLAPAHCLALGGTSAGPGTNAWTRAENADTRVGLVAQWKMDENSGTTAADSAGTNNATLLNGPVFASGKFGRSMVLDGTDDHATVPHGTALSLNNAFTLAAWVYLEAFPPPVKFGTVLWKGTGATTWNYALELQGNQLMLEFKDTGGTTRAFAGGSMTVRRKWYHIAAIYDDATDSVRLYVDGVQVSASTTTAIPATNTNGLTIGRSPYGDYLNGWIDDVRIYSRVLSPAEIGTLIGGGEP